MRSRRSGIISIRFWGNPITEKNRKSAAVHLVKWFQQNRRNLPWRTEDIEERRDPYVVWISEIMLQQTQVDAVIQHYQRWMQRFPDISTLARANESDVMRCWQGLGYYSRARNILRTAIRIEQEYHGHFPRERKRLEELPGIGAYTAGAILSLAMGQSEPILDGNLVRIFSRLQGWDFLPDNKINREQYWALARQWCESGPAHRVNEALMELGALVCKPANPECSGCPLCDDCCAGNTDSWKLYPPRKKTNFSTWKGYALILFNSAGDVWCVRNADSFFLKNQCNFPLFTTAEGHSAEELISAYLQKPLVELEKTWRIASAQVRHAITRYKLEVTVLVLQSRAPADESGAWIPAQEVETHIVNSLGLKIWKAVRKIT